MFIEDIVTYISPQAQDIVFLNSNFHFYPKDLKNDKKRLYHWINQLIVKGRLVIIILMSSKSIESIKSYLKRTAIFAVNSRRRFDL